MHRRLALVLGATGILAALALGPLPASATSPGSNGLILFDRGSALAAMHANGSHVRVLQHKATSGAYSADGKLIAFERNFDVFTMRANGSHVKRVTHTGDAGAPSFFPNGKQLVYYGDSGMFRIHTNGSHRRKLTDHFGFDLVEPVVSPNGGLITFAAHNSIQVMRVNGSHRRVLLRHGPNGDVDHPDFSPNGRRIVFEKARFGATLDRAEIFVMHTDGSHLKRLSHSKKPRLDEHPVFSPNGKKIVFLRGRGNTVTLRHPQIMVMRANGSGVHRLGNALGTPDDWQPLT